MLETLEAAVYCGHGVGVGEVGKAGRRGGTTRVPTVYGVGKALYIRSGKRIKSRRTSLILIKRPQHDKKSASRNCETPKNQQAGGRDEVCRDRWGRGGC